MSGIVTLAERHRRKMEHMRVSIEEVDGLLRTYARQHGGRFIRYGSTAKGRAMAHSDVDIIADFDGSESFAAARYAERVCSERNLKPDVRPSAFVSERFTAQVSEGGVLLE